MLDKLQSLGRQVGLTGKPPFSGSGGPSVGDGPLEKPVLPKVKRPPQNDVARRNRDSLRPPTRPQRGCGGNPI